MTAPNEPTVAVLVPRRDEAEGGTAHRDGLWDYCKTWWHREFPDWPIVEGHHPGPEPFNRAAALNLAHSLAPAADVYLVIDGDVIPDARAIREGVRVALATGSLVVCHDERIMLNQRATQRILAGGLRGDWRDKRYVETTWWDSCSCVVAVTAEVWERTGGFDPLFSGWGFEDTAFRVTAETTTGTIMLRVSAATFHLHHQGGADTNPNSATYRANVARNRLYHAAARDVDKLSQLTHEAEAERQRLRAPEADAPSDGVEMPLPASRNETLFTRPIPKVLFRTVPAETTPEVEEYWQRFRDMHPGWQTITYRDPLPAGAFPLTSDLWDRCENGAQKAGLIRLEGLFNHGGVYVDSDCEPLQPLDTLLGVRGFAAWEDETTVPDAVIGFAPEDPLVRAMIDEAREMVLGEKGAWESGPGVTTRNLPGAPGVLLLPPGAFYPYHYLQKSQAELVGREATPWAFLVHRWRHSWGDEASKRSIEENQR